jgi:glycosyltransferase involved in cell wall biosynthesis
MERPEREGLCRDRPTERRFVERMESLCDDRFDGACGAEARDAMKITCVIPVYNAGRYLAESLDSVLAQDWPLHEIIVVDDGSTDNGKDIIGGYASPVRMVEQSHSGEAAARNRGIREATGDVIAFQDADDVWPQGRLRGLAEALARMPHADIVGGLVETIDQRAVKPAVRERRLETKHRPMSLPSLLIRRQVFDRVGLFNEALMRAEDTEFIMRCRQLSVRHAEIDAVTLVRRLHESNISSDVDGTFANTVYALRVVSTMRRKS